MASAQARIAETIDGFYSDNSDAAMAGHAYKRAVEELDTRTARELDAPYRATVLEPVGKLCSYFPEINNTISKRNKKVSNWVLAAHWGLGDWYGLAHLHFGCGQRGNIF